MDKWIVKSSENLIDNNLVKVRRDDVELPNGEEIKDFYVVSFNEAVAIVALDCTGNLILTKQCRHSYNKELIEIPAGAFKKNEKDGLSVAKRELREETGYVSDEWLYLGPTIESSSKLTNYLHLYFAKDCRKVGDQQLDATEELETFLLPIETAVDMVMKNEICSNSSAHGILRVARMLKNRRKQMDCMKEYKRWMKQAIADADIANELKRMNDSQIEDAFYRDLAFGTGGLRGVIGAGTNRMNVYTVAKASQGLADYLKKHYETPSVAIGYESRIKSDVFAKIAAGVFAANGVQVNIWPELMPVPTVSFATRYLHTSAGVMITASHNPSKYNGYKVYSADGCQITTEVAVEILTEIEKLDIFADVKTGDFEAGMAEGRIQYIPEEVYTAFVNEVKAQSVLFGEEVDKDVAIVYSPLNGSGLRPVTRTLKEMGYTNITVVKEQEQPDGNFPTCPYPNPEIKEAMALGMEYAKLCNADLLLATDPDCDRVGIAVKNQAGAYELLTGNQVGLLLLDYICSQRIKHGKMSDDPVMVKTIVTMDMGEQIASHYGVRTINVLTGFKFIGEQIGRLERQGKADSYVFGFEESYGYLTGSYVRDKDGVDGAYMICEMFSYYKTQGMSLLEKLNELYHTYGYCMNTLHSYEFEGSAGFARMQSIMQAFRGDVRAFGGKNVVKLLDYAVGLDGLPKSDVLKFLLEGNCSIVVRPSGTEPKLKIYVSVSAQNKEAAEAVEKSIIAEAEEYLK